MSDWLRASFDGLPKMSWFMKLLMAVLSRTAGLGMVRKFLSDPGM
jgi:hypothetical protein